MIPEIIADLEKALESARELGGRTGAIITRHLEDALLRACHAYGVKPRLPED